MTKKLFWCGETVAQVYSSPPITPALQQLQKSSSSASTTPQWPIWNFFATVEVRDFWENGCRWHCV